MKTETPIPDVRLADLIARTEECGDCLEWTRHALDGKFPQWRVDGYLWPTRRLLWILTRGPIKPGQQVGVKCSNPLCVHPDHLVSRTKAKAAPRGPMPIVQRQRISSARRAKSTLDIETVRAIRASDEMAIDLDARYGLRAGYSSRIRLNKVWRDHANPFGGLGAHA